MKKHFYLLFLLLAFVFPTKGHAVKKVQYKLTDEPIDVVIVCHAKDKMTLDYCIEGIQENCSEVRRIIVVSATRLTDNAEWFDEQEFPFSVDDVILAVGREEPRLAQKYFHKHWRPPGWYLQQLLKLYAPFVIPEISSNVLVLDADTIFFNRVKFLNDSNGGLFCVSHLRPKDRYLKFASRLLPEHRPHKEVYTICHHMLLQKPILKDLFRTVERKCKVPFWKAFCYNVDLVQNKGASEYQLYSNFALSRTNQVKLRELKWKNSGNFGKKNHYKAEGYHFVSFQDYMRKK